MKTATINFKTEESIKKQAQALAQVIGIPLGSLLNAYLREFVHTREVFFSNAKVRKSRTMEQIMKNLDDQEREELRLLLNKENLKRYQSDENKV